MSWTVLVRGIVMAYNRRRIQKKPPPNTSTSPQRQEQDEATETHIFRQLRHDKPQNFSPAAIQYLQATVGNQAVQRLLATSQQRRVIQRDPDDSSADTASEPATMEFDFTDVEVQIGDLFDQYDQMEVNVPNEKGGKTTINVHLAYFISSFKSAQQSELDALREKEDLSAEEKKKLKKLTKREKRYKAHMQVKDALKQPLTEVYGKDEMKKIVGKYKGGKGAPEYYQKLIQTAIDQAAAAGKKKKGLPQPGTTVDEWQTNVQAWVNEHHVGVDCSGMVDHMLETIAASQGQTYSRWDKKHPVKTLSDLQAGDVFSKPKVAGEVGHVRVVQSVDIVKEPQEDGTSKEWLMVTLVESASSVKGANTRFLRFPYDDPSMSMDDAIQVMQEDLGAGWKAAKGERKKYTAYRKISG
jgi:hypothetical protein